MSSSRAALPQRIRRLARLRERIARLNRAAPPTRPAAGDPVAPLLQEAEETLRLACQELERHARHAGRRQQSALATELPLVEDLILDIVQAGDLTRAMALAVERICELTGWDYGEAWIPEAGGQYLVDTPVWHVRSEELDEFQRATHRLRFARGEGLVGRVWQTGAPEWLEDLSDPATFRRFEAAHRAGLAAGVAVPLSADGNTIAVLTFFMRRRRVRDDRLLALVSAAVAPLGPVIQQKRAEEELQRLNAELEQRVAERTAQLEAAIRELREGIIVRTRSAEALRASEARLRAVFETAAEGIIIIDERGVIESFNRAAEHIFGWREEEVLGRNVSLLMPAPHRDRHDEYLRRYLRTGERRVIGTGREFTGQRRDGRTFPMDLAVGEFHSPKGRHFTGIVRDVTERRRLQEESRRHQEELAHVARLGTMGEMAATLAHELNQPLHAISAYSQAALRLLRAEDAGSEKLVNALEQSVAQAQRAGGIIHRIRSFVRKGQPVREPVDVNGVIREAAELVAGNARHRGVELELALAPDVPAVQGDAIQLEQVLLNLMHNAVEAVAEAGDEPYRVTVESRRTEDDSLQVAVRDNGPGLDADAVERVFEPFYTSKAGGMGMGLSISRSIIEQHGGRLWLEPPQGAGACFRFALPAAHARARHAGEADRDGARISD